MSNNLHFDTDIKQGEEYQDFIQHELLRHGIVLLFNTSQKYQLHEGEGISGIEVKYDRKVKDTGNVFIETEAETKDKTMFVSGGIAKQDNAWLYLIGDYTKAWLFSKSQLVSMWHNPSMRQSYIDSGYIKPMTCKDETGHIFSKGFLILRPMLEKSSLIIRRFNFDKN